MAIKAVLGILKVSGTNISRAESLIRKEMHSIIYGLQNKCLLTTAVKVLLLTSYFAYNYSYLLYSARWAAFAIFAALSAQQQAFSQTFGLVTLLNDVNLKTVCNAPLKCISVCEMDHMGCILSDVFLFTEIMPF